MKKFPASVTIVALLGLLIVFVSVLLRFPPATPTSRVQMRATAIVVNAPPTPSATGIIFTNTPAIKPEPLIGETLLRGYATASTP